MTAVEKLINDLKELGIYTPTLIKLCNEAKELEKEQAGDLWDAAIKAHNNRGHVCVRSMCDFDDYWDDLQNKK